MQRSGIYYSFRPVYFVSKFLGVMPLKYARRANANDVVDHRQRGNALRSSKGNAAFTFFWLALALFQSAYIPHYMFTTNSRGMKGNVFNATRNVTSNATSHISKNTNVDAEDLVDSWQSRVLLVLNPIITSAMGVQCRLTSFFKLPKILPGILTKLQQSDILLRTTERQHQACYRYLLRVFLLYSFVASVSLTYYLHAFSSTHNAAVALGMVCLQICNIVSFCTELQFSALCYCTLVRFKQIGVELKKWRQINEAPSDFPGRKPLAMYLNEFSKERNLNDRKNNVNFFQLSNFRPRNGKPPTFINVKEISKNTEIRSKIGDFFSQVKKLFLNKKTEVNSLENETKYKSLAEMLANIRQSHAILYEVMSETNALYRGQLLISMSGCFLNGLLNIYFTIFGYVSPNPVGNALQNLYASKLHQVLGNFALCSYFVTRFVIMTKMASETVDESQVCIGFASALNQPHIDEVSKEELQIFYNHAQCYKPIFSACGYFTLDMNLITAALSAWCTYLVIMAQFHAAR